MPRILRLLYAYQTENYNFLLFNWEKVTFLKLFVRLLGGSSFRLLFQLTGMKRKWMPFWRLLFHKEYSCKAWEKEHCWKVWPIENIKKKWSITCHDRCVFFLLSSIEHSLIQCGLIENVGCALWNTGREGCSAVSFSNFSASKSLGQSLIQNGGSDTRIEKILRYS